MCVKTSHRTLYTHHQKTYPQPPLPPRERWGGWRGGGGLHLTLSSAFTFSLTWLENAHLHSEFERVLSLREQTMHAYITTYLLSVTGSNFAFWYPPPPPPPINLLDCPMKTRCFLVKINSLGLSKPNLFHVVIVFCQCYFVFLLYNLTVA